MNSGISPKLRRSLRHDAGEHLGRLRRVLGAHVGAEADGVLTDPAADDLVETGERATADEEDVRRVDREELLVGMLAPPCGGTEATVPSRIFSSACWTPSPDTSRVIDGLSAFRAILSTSSM
jgi:hypothetical protein